MGAFPLLSTKLNLPPRRPSLVSRPRLLQQLDLSLLPGNRLTILSAPAGFGKTSLVVDWQVGLVLRGIPLCWLSLDEGDNDLPRFLRYLVAALQKIQPELGQTCLATLDLPQPPAVESLMVPLINDLGGAPGDLVLVLDDYQVINHVLVHQAVGYLVEHQPAQFHLLLTTRVDPLLPLARLRARGEVNEIRAADLRFNQEETLAFIQRNTRLDLSAAQGAALDQHTEGWVAGLQMAGIALQAYQARHGARAVVDDFLASFSGTHQFVFDYLAQEVLQQQEAQVIDFLHQTSLLDRFTPDLCDALTGRDDSEQILKTLDQSNLFLLPLDERRSWYRYHRLFADFLRAGLDAQRQPELFLRASAWFEHNGLVEEAISYAIKAQDWSRASRLVRESAPALMNAGEVSTLLNYFSALPVSVLSADPDLCIYHGWVTLLTNRMGIAITALQQAEKNIREGTPTSSLGRLEGLKAYLAYAMENSQEAIRLAEGALGLMGPADFFFRTTVLSLLGQIQRNSGNIPASIRTYEEAIQTAEIQLAGAARPVNTGLVILQGSLAISYTMHGERRRAAAYCQEALRRCTDAKGQVYPLVLFIYLPWAEICFQGNELVEAQRYAEMGIELCRNLGINPVVIGGSNTLAAIRLISGDVVGAFADIRAVQQEALRLQLPWIAANAAVVEARFELQCGNLSAAEAWAQNVHLPPLTGMDPGRIDAHLTLVRLLLAQGRFETALTQANRVRVQVEQGEWFSYLIEIYILLALAHRGLGQMSEACQYFERAAHLAAPEGSLRPFLNDDTRDLQSDLAATLPAHPSRELAAFLDRLAALYSSELAPAFAARPVLPVKPVGLVEPITPRELDVLRLMAEGLSNAEIARKLYLTVNTLKAHANSIYGKLDVHSRLQAVNRARELGLL